MIPERIYHVIWKDYDGTYQDRYTYEPDALKEIGVIAAKEQANSYGTELLHVFYGVEVEINIAPPVALEVTLEVHK